MNKCVDPLKLLTAAFALGALVNAGGTQALAKDRNLIGPARSSAIHDCNIEASKYSPITQLLNQFAMYGTCINDHGQRFG